MLLVTQPSFNYLKLTVETLEQGVKYWRRSGVFVVNPKLILHLVLVCLLLTLNTRLPAGYMQFLKIHFCVSRND